MTFSLFRCFILYGVTVQVAVAHLRQVSKMHSKGAVSDPPDGTSDQTNKTGADAYGLQVSGYSSWTSGYEKRSEEDDGDLLTFAARDSPSLFKMEVIGGAGVVQDDWNTTLKLARLIKPTMDPDLKLIYHTYWVGPLNEKTLVSVKACFYYNIQTL